MIKKFKIKELKDLYFRNKELSPIKVLSLQTQIDLNDMEKTEKLFKFILENTEVSLDDTTYFPVKEVNSEIYYPKGIEKNLKALNEICSAFMNEVIFPLFTESSK